MPDALAAIKIILYVDDYLGLAGTETEAINIVPQVRTALASGDFHLVGWQPNTPACVEAQQPGSGPVRIDGETNPLGPDTELVLGITCKPLRDVLGFRVEGLANVVYTRVDIVRKVASIFDPLGIAAPIVVKAKIRLRCLVLKGLGCSDPIDDQEREWSAQLFTKMAELGNVEFPCCLFPREDNIYVV